MGMDTERNADASHSRKIFGDSGFGVSPGWVKAEDAAVAALLTEAEDANADGGWSLFGALQGEVNSQGRSPPSATCSGLVAVRNLLHGPRPTAINFSHALPSFATNKWAVVG